MRKKNQISNGVKYHIITYGCQTNKSDSERTAAVLENVGYLLTSKENEADLIILNACSVRQSAMDRIFGQVQKFGKLKIQNPKLKIILTGCILPTDKEKLNDRVDLILDIKNLPKLPEKLLTMKQFNNEIIRMGNRVNHYLTIEPKYSSPLSVSIPIMTGCDNFCTYCAVPYTRGREVSRPVEDILCEVKRAVKAGAKEIWLLGQNVNSYKSKIQNPKSKINFNFKIKNSKLINFPILLKMVNDITGNFWIRFTSPHPKDFSDELIETMARCKKVAPYLNLPIQSGNNEILKKMNRPYTVERYKKLIKKIRAKFKAIRDGLEKDIAISTDVIVGFPSETKKQFENTARLMRQIKFDMAYIAQFSPRPGTTAARMKDNVSHQEKERRWKILTSILRKTALKNNKKFIGKEIEVLIDETKDRTLFGKSRHYKTVKILLPAASSQRLTASHLGQFVKTKIIDALSWGLKGELTEETKSRDASRLRLL